MCAMFTLHHCCNLSRRSSVNKVVTIMWFSAEKLMFNLNCCSQKSADPCTKKVSFVIEFVILVQNPLFYEENKMVWKWLCAHKEEFQRYFCGICRYYELTFKPKKFHFDLVKYKCIMILKWIFLNWYCNLTIIFTLLNISQIYCCMQPPTTASIALIAIPKQRLITWPPSFNSSTVHLRSTSLNCCLCKIFLDRWIIMRMNILFLKQKIKKFTSIILI